MFLLVQLGAPMNAYYAFIAVAGSAYVFMSLDTVETKNETSDGSKIKQSEPVKYPRHDERLKSSKAQLLCYSYVIMMLDGFVRAGCTLCA